MKELSDVLGKVTDSIYSKKGYVEGQILTNWMNIVGSEIASCSIPDGVVFSGNKKHAATLKIQVSSDKIFELDFMKDSLIERINNYFGYNAIGRIVIKQYVPLLKSESSTESPKEIKTNKDIEITKYKAIIKDYSEEINQIDDDSLRDIMGSFSKLLK